MAQFVGIEQALIIPDWEQNFDYPTGFMVLYNGTIYRSNAIHNSGTVFQEYLWTGVGGGNSGVPRLHEVVHTFQMPAGGNLSFDLDATMNKYDIRTVHCSANKTGDMKVSIYDKAVDGVCVYQSLSQYPIYDIVNVPCEDKDGGGKLHVTVESLIPIDSTITLRIKLTSLT